MDAELLADERAASIEQIRMLDKQHLERCRALHDKFDAEVPAEDRKSVAVHRRELAALIAPTSAILIAGGHVGVLLNRLRLFDLVALAGSRPIIAWSAGAMCLCDLVVLFHDDPPNGQGRAEILDVGLGLVPNMIALPDPKHRLRLHDPSASRTWRGASHRSPARRWARARRSWRATARVISASGAQQLQADGTTAEVTP